MGTPAASASLTLTMLEFPVSLFKKAIADEVFSRFTVDSDVLDLHGINVEVAKVCVFAALRDILELPAGHTRHQASLRVVVGKGLHSPDGERKIGPAVHDFLRGALGFKLPRLEDDVGVIEISAQELRRVRRAHPYFRPR